MEQPGEPIKQPKKPIHYKTQYDWDIFFLKLSKQYSTGSKDPSTKVGCVIADGKWPVSFGYNGFEADSDDCPVLYDDRNYKIQNIIHAEDNAIRRIPKEPYLNLTIYIFPFLPCQNCAKKIVNYGQIKRVVASDYCPERWVDSLNSAVDFLSESGIKVQTYPIVDI